jgi:hypothetical protein
MEDLRVNSVFMTVKRKWFWRVMVFVVSLDVAIHFSRALQIFLPGPNGPLGWPDSFYWLLGAAVIIAWNTFATTVNTLFCPLGLAFLAIMIGWYYDTRPARPPKI